MSLYNGTVFPDYIFKEKHLKILFFDFNECFSDEFITALKKYLRNVGIGQVTLNGIQPELLPFKKVIETENLVEKFRVFTKSFMQQSYINSDVSFYMMTEIAELFPFDNENAFTMVYDRGHEVAIFGATSDAYLEVFDYFRLEDVHDYLSGSMGNYYSIDFESKLNRNYFNR